MKLNRSELQEMGISNETITLLRNAEMHRPSRFWDSAKFQKRHDGHVEYMSNELELAISTEQLEQQRRRVSRLISNDL